jgi:serine/threonine-protein kinase
MDDRTDPRVESHLSQAETLAGAADPPRAAADPEFPVKAWDRYEFVRFLGQGGMGMVFLARDRKLGREVAIKFVRVESGPHLQRFMVEARAQARVDHEHVCKVFEVGEVEGKVFITMQYIHGIPLDAIAGLSLEQKVIVLRDAARGVHEAHRAGIIHRDLKPSNILVERADDGSLRAFVMDFGLAKEWNQDVTETGSVLGTPAYMSPEQARGEVSRLDRRTDIYSLGATLYQVATGLPPFSGANALEILSAIASTEVQPLRTLRPDLPRDLEAITLKCLEKERSKRYDSARALADDLDRFLAGEPVQARPTDLWYRVQRKLRKHRQLALVGALSLGVALVALGTALKTRRDAGRRERLAQQFTEAMGRIESTARYSALSPLHDIRPDLQAVRAHMAQLETDMQRAGSLANGPGHYALGRGYWTLDDGEKAREHLQMAWDAGYREPRVAYALGTALGRQYQEKLLEAERIPAAGQREARKKALDATLRAPALGYLRRARGSDAPSPVYLEALMAFYEGRLDEALDRLKSLQEGQPWFYEAPLLRGSLLQARAWKHWNQGERDAAHADFEAGRRALGEAASSGRSAPAVHAALAELELNAMFMEKYGQGQVEPAYTRGLAAIQRALAAQPDHVPSLILQASLMGQLADFKAGLGEDAESLVSQAADIARQAVAAGPTRADAWIALGRAYYLWGSARANRNLDPTDQLAQGLRAFESLSPEKRDYTVWNHLGLIQQTWAQFEDGRGQDPTAHLGGAIGAFETATRLEPALLPAWINLGTCLHLRAGLPRAAHPDEDLRSALQVLEQARTLNPKHVVPYFMLGKVHYAQALRTEARGGDPRPDLVLSAELARQGIAINPGIPHLHNSEGMAVQAQAQASWDRGEDPSALLAQAEGCYRRAMAVAPGQVFAYLNLSDLLIWKGRHLGVPGPLREAETLLQAALKALPGSKGLLANLGRCHAVRIEQALTTGADPTRDLQAGEAALAKALALDAKDHDSLQYLGELRAAAAAWKARRGRAGQGDFDRAAEAFQRALASAPDSQETLLAQAALCRTRAAWTRVRREDPGPSLARGQAALEQVTRARPRWAEALALRGSLALEEAEGLAPGGGSPKAGEALKDLGEALALNRNLARVWRPWMERAQHLERALLSR